MAKRHLGRRLMARVYSGNLPSNVSKDAKYSVVRGSDGWDVRLVYRLSSSERALVTTSSHPELVQLVNDVKEDVNGVAGGAFYINEYRHVLVPTEDGCRYAGRYTQLLEFRFEGLVISAQAPPDVAPGDDWRGPRTGTAYVLSADGSDIRYRVESRPNVITERKLSAEIGRGQAAVTARAIAQFKPSGGRIYLNEACECFGPSPGRDRLVHRYFGRVDLERWFAEPQV
jgi:hypothetical protein